MANAKIETKNKKGVRKPDLWMVAGSYVSIQNLRIGKNYEGGRLYER